MSAPDSWGFWQERLGAAAAEMEVLAAKLLARDRAIQRGLAGEADPCELHGPTRQRYSCEILCQIERARDAELLRSLGIDPEHQ